MGVKGRKWHVQSVRGRYAVIRRPTGSARANPGWKTVPVAWALVRVREGADEVDVLSYKEPGLGWQSEYYRLLALAFEKGQEEQGVLFGNGGRE